MILLFITVAICITSIHAKTDFETECSQPAQPAGHRDIPLPKQPRHKCIPWNTTCPEKAKQNKCCEPKRHTCKCSWVIGRKINSRKWKHCKCNY